MQAIKIPGSIKYIIFTFRKYQMPRGRPRKIDPETVLDAIMMTFWKHGYLDTTMSHLTQATNMAKPGLYAAFGDKEALFQTAIKQYNQQIANPMLMDVSLSDDSTKQVFTRYLDRVASTALNPLGPKGCLAANCLVQCPTMSNELSKLSQAENEYRRGIFLTRLKQAKEKGELSEHSNPESLSHFIMGQTLAITVMAKAGADKQTLDKVINVAMASLTAQP